MKKHVHVFVVQIFLHVKRGHTLSDRSSNKLAIIASTIYTYTTQLHNQIYKNTVLDMNFINTNISKHKKVLHTKSSSAFSSGSRSTARSQIAT